MSTPRDSCRMIFAAVNGFRTVSPLYGTDYLELVWAAKKKKAKTNGQAKAAAFFPLEIAPMI